MSVNIDELGKDASFNADDYILKDGSTNGTRLISVQNAADGFARKTTVGLKRPSSYDEATSVAGTDYLIKDDTSAPKRVTAQNAATSFAQLAQYDTAESISDQDFILKVGSSGAVTKVGAEQAAGNLAQLAGQVVGSEAVESAVAKGLADEALNQAINTVMPSAVDQLRKESLDSAVSDAVNAAVPSAVSDAVSDAVNAAVPSAVSDAVDAAVSTGAKDIVETGIGAAESVSSDSDLESTDQFIKWDSTNEKVKRVSAKQILGRAFNELSYRTSVYSSDDRVVMGTAPSSVYKTSPSAILNSLAGSESYAGYDANHYILYRAGESWYRITIRSFLNLIYSGTPTDTPTTITGQPADDAYFLNVYNAADNKKIHKMSETNVYKNIAKYVYRGTVLLDKTVSVYSDSASATLSDSVANYSCVEIFWKIDTAVGSSRVYVNYIDSTFYTDAYNMYVASSSGQKRLTIRMLPFTLNGDQLTIHPIKWFSIEFSDGTISNGTGGLFGYVTRVVGYT